jgi:hypothetical protein
MGCARRSGGRRDQRWGGGDFRFLRIERNLAPAAQVIVGSELDELTAITTNHFPGINWGKGRSHSELCGYGRQSVAACILSKRLALAVRQQ